MNAQLVIYSAEQVNQLVKKRAGETRLGEKMQTLHTSGDTLEERLLSSRVNYVLLGIPEDLGVRANYGRGGAYSAWQPVLNTMLNVQSNSFLTGEDILVLGHIDCTEWMEEVKTDAPADTGTIQKLRQLVSKLDEVVAEVAKAVFSAGKELIVIGGGHNNSYPLLKALSQVKNRTVSCINCDAHADLRPLEGRHSGNGFSYAMQEKYLGRYAMLGLQEIFNTATVLEKIQAHPESCFAISYESIFLYEEMTWMDAIRKCLHFTEENPAGLELDIDLIQNIPSSAKTSSGITTLQARQYVRETALHANAAYFHIAEAAPVLSHIKTDLKTGKLIAYLVTDYIKARQSVKKK